eukprot:1941825-Pyramimonas_sp.AAC.1
MVSTTRLADPPSVHMVLSTTRQVRADHQVGAGGDAQRSARHGALQRGGADQGAALRRRRARCEGQPLPHPAALPHHPRAIRHRLEGALLGLTTSAGSSPVKSTPPRRSTRG